jgi:hypothetical protein
MQPADRRKERLKLVGILALSSLSFTLILAAVGVILLSLFLWYLVLMKGC